MSQERVLVTGVSGYIGARIVPRLLEAGYRVRCAVRDPSRLQGRAWHAAVEIVRCDVLEADQAREALRDVAYAYYLVHSLQGGADYQERDVRAARTFAAAAADAGVARIFYLGGLAAGTNDVLSEHLRSRQQTGAVLREGSVPVTELQAGVIVGSGSYSFEIIRYLTERLPVMICPRWVYTKTQPIGVRDVLDYLVAALRTSASAGRIIQIGGADVVTYGEMMLAYARARGLHRALVPVPVLTPRLSSYWVNLVTPVPAAIARPLIDGLRNESVVRDDSARRYFPDIEPASLPDAIERALSMLDAQHVESSWSDALSSSHAHREPPAQLSTREGMIVEQRQRHAHAAPADVFRVVTGLGGERGYLYLDWAWRLRGFADRLIGGVGLRRGRRNPDTLRVGDALDFWRVEAIEPGRMLLLRAEMKTPGRAWLQFDVVPGADGETLVRQSAYFAPRGLSGWLYWYTLYPIHALIFSGLIHRIAQRSERARGQPHLAGGRQ